MSIKWSSLGEHMFDSPTFNCGSTVMRSCVRLGEGPEPLAGRPRFLVYFEMGDHTDPDIRRMGRSTSFYNRAS